MLPTHALMESLSANLHQFLQRIDGDLTKPQKKFLRDGMVGLVRAGRPIICEIARKIPPRGATFPARRDRLETRLNDESELDQAVRESLPALWAPRVRDDTPIILDLTDIAKPLAEKMDYLATVRDGSTGELVNGYWMIELYASIRRKNPIPILMHPFSHEEPLCPGQNPLIIEAVRQVFRHTGGCGVLVIDRGGDARVLMEDWLDQRIPFVVRLRGDRDLLRFYEALGGAVDGVETCRDGQWVRVEARVLAEQIPTPHRWRFLAKSKGRTEVRTCQVGWVKVRLPGRPEELTMVVSRMPGRQTPLMLLTSLPVACFCDARRVLRHYRRRWECEMYQSYYDPCHTFCHMEVLCLGRVRAAA